MAPTTTIETITITRPLKVIAFICGIIVIILMIMALTSNDWLLADGWRQGLFMHCIAQNASLPLPFNVVAEEGTCEESRDVCEFSYKIRPGRTPWTPEMFQSTSRQQQSCASSLLSQTQFQPSWLALDSKRSTPTWSTSSTASQCWSWWCRFLPSSPLSYCTRCALPPSYPTETELCGSLVGLTESVSWPRATATRQTQLKLFLSLRRLGSCDFPLWSRRPPPVRQRVWGNLLQGAQNCAWNVASSWLEIFVPAWSVDLNST